MTTPPHPILVNLGSGDMWHPQWQNYDLNALPPHVTALDVRRPLPFGDATVDAIYHSHVLEHLSKQEARLLTGECRRVLRSTGILRVVVPDLERIARAYLDSLRSRHDGRRGVRV